jgi:hypothetical protein
VGRYGDNTCFQAPLGATYALVLKCFYSGPVTGGRSIPNMLKGFLREKRLGTKAHFAPTGLEDWSVMVSTHIPVLTDRERAS